MHHHFGWWQRVYVRNDRMCGARGYPSSLHTAWHDDNPRLWFDDLSNVMLPGSVLPATMLSPGCMASMSTSAIHWARCSFPAAGEEQALQTFLGSWLFLCADLLHAMTVPQVFRRAQLSKRLCTVASNVRDHIRSATVHIHPLCPQLPSLSAFVLRHVSALPNE
jgi:hypothetical protein